MPGWSVVLAKEARGRRICLDAIDHGLGQEQHSGDLEAYSDMTEAACQEAGGHNEGMDAAQILSARRRGQQPQSRGGSGGPKPIRTDPA